MNQVPPPHKPFLDSLRFLCYLLGHYFVPSQVININDSPPKLSQDIYETVLLLPTYVGVEVLRVEASDPDFTSDLALNPDKSITPQLLYSLVDSNVENFSVDRYTGVVTVVNQNLNKDRYRFNVKVRNLARHMFSLCRNHSQCISLSLSALPGKTSVFCLS